MLSQQRQSGPQREEPLTDGLSKDFHLVVDGHEAALTLPEVTPPAKEGGNQSWRLLLISLLGCFAASGAAVGAFLWLINLPPTANCENTATVTTDRAQLFCAQTAAESGELPEVLAALDLISSWPAEHPLHQEVQPLVEQWSWVVLKAAEQELRGNGSMAEAQALVGHIPVDSPVFATAQETVQAWQGEWDQGEVIMATAQKALQQKDWPTASKQVLALAELKNSHWRVGQVQTLSRQIRQERQAQQLLERAVATAAPGGSDRLGAALRTASQIGEDTYARQHAQPYLNRWSDLLLKLGLDKWYASDLDTAIALGRSAALNPSRAQVGQELIWLSQARQKAQQSLITWRTSPDQMVTLYQAMLMANQVPQSSPYYPQAQSSVATWRHHLGDLTQLQTAQAVGQVRDRDALKAAIAQAQTIPLGHPRRVQAQTMVAYWRQEIERLEDRPQLVKAHELAQAKTFAGLQAAIQAASAVPLNRALRAEAQSWVYIWTSEFQVMEDRPLLNRARSLAAQGKLSQAIAEATDIKPGRALYKEAMAAIADWQRQIAAVEQARLRALQETVTPLEPAESLTDAISEDPEATDESLELSTPAGLRPLAPAPAPASMRRLRDRLLRESSLPDRIETVPGEAAPAPAEATTPVLPGGETSAPGQSPPSPLAPGDAAKPNEAPPALVAPARVPAAAPSPVLVAPPVPVPQPIDVTPEPDPAGEPQARLSTAPRVSANPQPEVGIELRLGSPRNLSLAPTYS